MPGFVLGVRLVLAAVFAVAGIAKLEPPGPAPRWKASACPRSRQARRHGAARG